MMTRTRSSSDDDFELIPTPAAMNRETNKGALVIVEHYVVVYACLKSAVNSLPIAASRL